MKNSIHILVALLFFMLLSLQNKAQKTFSGRITYEITYEGAGLNESMKSFLPGEMTFTIKGNVSRTELITAMGNQVTIFDGNTKTVINLIDIMGKKIAIRKSTEEVELERKKYNNVKVSLTDESKLIVAYECKKASIEVNAADFNGNATFNVYYTSELGNLGINYSDPLFNQIEGVMLQYEINTKGLLMKFLAKAVVQEDVDDSAFSIPPDYKETTEDELKKMFGSGLN